jgi:DNA (cytosine-5)-methyltransferase 1
MHSIISFFTGAGFLDLGFEHAGFRVDMVNEYASEFLDGYMHSREHLGSPRPRYGHHLGSIEEFISGDHLSVLEAVVKDIRRTGRKVGFVGGPPCPDFSIGGKNAGSEGDHGRLTSIYFDLICKIKPDFFVFENVEGLWRTKVHRQFYDEQKAIVSEFGFTLYDRLTSAVAYGVGQDRKRIFLIGVLNGSENLKFPFEASMSHSEDVLDLNWPTTKEFCHGDFVDFPDGRNLPRDLTVQHWFDRNDVENHPNGDMWFNPQSDKFHTVAEGDVKKKSFKRLHRWRYSPTAAYGNNEVHLHPNEPRRISVAEALAIQSLPADYQLPEDMTLSACFKTIGNGVPYLAALGLAKSLDIHLRAEDASIDSQHLLAAE